MKPFEYPGVTTYQGLINNEALSEEDKAFITTLVNRNLGFLKTWHYGANLYEATGVSPALQNEQDMWQAIAENDG
jgi:hypothetical protein